jgi:hypothetical protein
MALPSRNESAVNNKNNYYPVTGPTIPGFSAGGGGTSEQGSSQFSGIDNPDALQMLMEVLQQVNTGGTPDQKRIQAERTTEIGRTRSISQDYSKQAAFKDAADLMAQNLRQSLERNMPAISKAIQGAGTSQSSMQGLLSQKLATESAQAAGTLGAQQAAQYGGISAQLQSVLEALTRKDNSAIESLLKGLDLFKINKGASFGSSRTNPSVSVTQSGGGQTLTDLRTTNVNANVGNNNIQDGVWYGPGMVPRDQSWVDSTSGLPQVSGASPNKNAYGDAYSTLEDTNWGYGD